ncbi:hypothetical protein CS542_00130 [Pedobacter sp. IW39]|nr:hypothetical protein CS542_00130 [Pedobacter sp. IW39]
MRFQVLCCALFCFKYRQCLWAHVSDPRTGQILETHIGWYHNVMNLLRNWYFVQTAAVNPAARKAKLMINKWVN